MCFWSTLLLLFHLAALDTFGLSMSKRSQICRQEIFKLFKAFCLSHMYMQGTLVGQNCPKYVQKRFSFVSTHPSWLWMVSISANDHSDIHEPQAIWWQPSLRSSSWQNDLQACAPRYVYYSINKKRREPVRVIIIIFINLKNQRYSHSY